MNERHPPLPPTEPAKLERPALTALPAFADNYIWMLHDGRDAWVVDPGDAAPVISCLQQQDLNLQGILVTHHHSDHVGGIEGLRPLLQGQVYGPARERIPEPFVPLREGDVISVLGWSFRVIELPGHTAGHIAYVQQAGHAHAGADQALPAPLLFCGDTLFSAGCGRLFEGTPAQMAQSLAKLAALPAATRVCCTHEYTLANLRFAAAVEPDNGAIHRHRQVCEAKRAQGLPTLPSSIGLELQINPFLRCAVPAVASAALAAEGRAAPDADNPADTVAVLAALRTWKNHF